MMQRYNAIMILAFVAVCAAALSVGSCGDASRTAYSRFVSVDAGKWNNTEYCYFPLDEAPAHTFSDSLQRYDLVLTVRHNTDFPYNNLWIVLDRTFGLDSISTEKVNLRLADESGNWRGHAMQGLYEFSDTIMRKAAFSSADMIALHHDMPQTIVPGIVDIGVTLVESE